MSVRSDIINVLESSHCNGINFRLGAISVRGQGYQTIARCVRNRQIQVVESSLPATKAAYNRRFNVFIVGSSPNASLVAHEATHALNDWHQRTVTSVEDEMAAYVAQCLFLFSQNAEIRRAVDEPVVQSRTQRAVQACGRDASACENAVFGQALIVAAAYARGDTPTAEQLRTLREVVQRHPDTNYDPQRPRRSYDAIHRTALPADFLREYRGHVVEN